MTQAIAKLNYLKMSPRKVRLIASLIRGMSIFDAEAQLFNQNRRAAEPLLKLLRSCIANAKNAKMDESRLFVSKITVDQGPVMKRFLPRAQGRATPILKKMSHVVISLEEGNKVYLKKFTLLKQEKSKKEEKKKVVSKKPKETDKSSDIALKSSKPERSGFLKRIFNRKSV